MGAVDVRPDVREGLGVQAQRGGQLGPGGRHRARQRAGHRRARLAFRGPRGAARDPPLVPQDHRLRGGAADRPRRHRLAGGGQDDAAQLDRALGGGGVRLPAGRRGRPDHRVHDPPRHHLRRDLHGRRDRAPARRGGGRGEPRGRRVHRGVPAHGDFRGVARDRGEAGHRHRPQRDPSDDRGGGPDLDRELRPDELRHRRDHGRARPRPPRPRVRDPLRSPHRAGHPPGRRRRGGPRRRRRRVRRAGDPDRLRGVRRHDLGRRVRGDRRPARGRGQGAAHRQLPAARLGGVPPALLGLPGPRHHERRPGGASGAGGPAPGGAAGGRGRLRRRLPPRHPPRLRADGGPRDRRPGAARHRHLRHVHGVRLVPRALRLPRLRHRDGGRAGELLAAGGPLHRRDRARHPAPHVRPLLPQGDARRGPRRERRAVREPPHPGHGAQRDLLPGGRERVGRLLLAGGSRDGARRQGPGDRGAAPGGRRAGHRRAPREDVEVEEQRHRPRGDGEPLRRGHHPALHDDAEPPQPDPRMERRRRRGRLPVPAAAVAHGRGPRSRWAGGGPRPGPARPGPARGAAQGPRDHRQGERRRGPPLYLQHRDRGGHRDAEHPARPRRRRVAPGPRPAPGGASGRHRAARPGGPARRARPLARARRRGPGGGRALAGARPRRPRA